MTSLLSRPARAVSLRTRRRTLATLFAVAAMAAGVPASLPAQAADGPSLVVLVRHAEKAAAPAADPDLSPAGQERAKALLETLLHVGPSAVVVTATRRTAETAAPLAARFGITPQVIALTGGGATHVNAVADAVRKARGVVVVVGHSNTVPAIVKALGGPSLPDLCDSSYATMFVLQPARDGKLASVVRAQYGAADPAAATGCPAMQPAR